MAFRGHSLVLPCAPFFGLSWHGSLLHRFPGQECLSDVLPLKVRPTQDYLLFGQFSPLLSNLTTGVDPITFTGFAHTKGESVKQEWMAGAGLFGPEFCRPQSLH